MNPKFEVGDILIQKSINQKEYDVFQIIKIEYATTPAQYIVKVLYSLNMLMYNKYSINTSNNYISYYDIECVDFGNEYWNKADYLTDEEKVEFL